ncbi:unnamed protein product [Rotaria sp. Silwood1]|nr:unnamed protein product [Rotaria sp. Silwood1]CAF4718517.1 unnamed protein product [Rotaria sp. Silwood1]
MAYLTVDQRNSWIKPTYQDFQSKLNAEKNYQNEVFYPIYHQLAEYKTYVDRLQLQSQIQFDLQQYISQIPVNVQTIHFKTEMYNPKNAHLSLRVLQQFIDSAEFLSMTKHIYELSRFYLLLHQTYAQLIEREKVWDITLKELHDRAKEHLSNFTCWHRRSEAKNHMDIITKGIEAVNAYHTFTNGLIRPGPCDETQRFTEISLSTPVLCLITNENPDEGDIIMRILRISIIQIALYNTGVITVNDADCSWINKIFSASLIRGKEYFLKPDTPFNFDFVYIQSYIIRTYLLLCHINYKHIVQKYQFYEPRKMIRAMTLNDNDDESFDLNENYSMPLEHEWNHLNDMLIDKLYHGYNLLKQIARIIKEEQNDSFSLSIYEFIQSIPENESIMQQLIHNQVRDFKLCHLNHIGKLYRDLIRNFEYSFVNIPDLLRTPIDADLSNKLQQIFERELINISYNENIDVLQSHIQQINQLLDDLKSIEDILLRQSTESLRSISENMRINNEILILIPKEIKCENYISLSICLDQVKSILQERKINIEEKAAHLWQENFDSNRNEQDIIGKNRYHRHLHGNDITDSTYSNNISNGDESDNEDDVGNGTDSPKYSSLFQLYVNAIPITSKQPISDANHQQPQKIEPMKKVQTFVIEHPNGKSESKMCKSDRLYEELRRVFNNKKYDLNTYVLVDNNKILFNFTNNNNHSSSPVSWKYFIVEKTVLISIQFHLGLQQFNYSTMPDCTLGPLMDHLINDHNLKLTSPNHRYCLYDETRRYIDGENIGDLHRMHRALPVIIHIQEQDDSTILYEVTLTSNQGGKKTAVFHPMTEWQQIEIWRKLVLPEIESLCVFWNRDNEAIVDEHQSIASSEITATTLDGIALDQTLHVILFFGTDTQHILILKSITIEQLLKDQHFPNLNLNNCCLAVGDTNDQILSKDDYRKQVDAYPCDDSGTIHFRILIPIKIRKNNDKQDMKTYLKNNTTTVEQLLQQIDISDNARLE